jgi:integrase
VTARKKTTAKIKLTKLAVEKLAQHAPGEGEIIVWDSDLIGFGVRVSSTQRCTYFIYARSRSGRQFKEKIGVHGAVTADKARDLAKTRLGEIAGGANPSEERKVAKLAEQKRLTDPTMRDLAEVYLRDYAEVHKRPSSVSADMTMLGIEKDNAGKFVERDDRAVTILSRMRSKKVADITSADVASLHREFRETPYKANRVVSLLSKMFGFAVESHMRPDNPALRIKRYQESPRERFLQPDELKRLAKALANHPERASANAIRFMLLTGARRGEVFAAEWNQFDLDEGVWTKPSAHTKQKRTHRVPLSPSAVELLRHMIPQAEAKRRRSDIAPAPRFVFPGKDAKSSLTNVKRCWATVCAEAEIEGVRVHDLRHTYASLLASEGLSLPIIGALLGHTQPRTTARYSHLLDDPLRAATTLVADRLAAISKAPEKVVSISGGR